MPIYANAEAGNFWKKGHARSLAATRFATLKTSQNGGSDESYRTTHARQVKNGSVHPGVLGHRASFISLLEEAGAISVFAKLEARLILNAGDGVIENGGICLDRNSGIPFIPGSAVKGCARRQAIWKLSQEPGPDAAARQLADLCLIFGYGDTEWKAGRDTRKEHSHSDFWLAMAPLENAGKEYDAGRNERWETVSEMAKHHILTALGREKFPKQLSGSISFLPGYPDKDPGIDLDIITNHHPKYYSGDNLVATDDENPNPVVFPAVAKGGVFRFCLLPCRKFSGESLLDAATEHLSEGLQTFGLGAKTNAGYGWFRIDKAAAKRAKDSREAAKLAESGPDSSIMEAVAQLKSTNQLAAKLNSYAIDEFMIDRLWPAGSTIAFELALFEFIKEQAPELMASKKGGKAMANLAKKLNKPL